MNTLFTKGHIDHHMKSYLLNDPDQTRTQQLYFLKKIHKGPHVVRPIVSGCSGPTEKISAFLNYYLQPLMQRIPSYVKDSKDMVNFLENTTFPTDCILATIDVTALYLNIPHKEGIASSIHHLYQLNPDKEEVPFPPATARTLLEVVLTRNFFEFDSKMYHQIMGTAMGTKMAPAYACLFMCDLEERLLEQAKHKPSTWKRYIDDVFVVWSGSRAHLDAFITHLNAAC